jgi:catechol 2,3-dioxygenase-like lactoylglutathione lyase family enzyme
VSGPSQPRWTHVALRVGDIGASIEWYQAFTPLQLLDRRSDEFGHGAWLGEPGDPERPFILVLAEFFPDSDPYRDSPLATLRPFSHLGIELPDRDAVDHVAARGQEAGCLEVAPADLPPPVGYVCMLRDPDGNLVEFSHDQGVFAKARELWG